LVGVLPEMMPALVSEAAAASLLPSATVDVTAEQADPRP
jgi:hypothetical protein